MSEQRRYGIDVCVCVYMYTHTHPMEYYSAINNIEICHLQQHG